MNTLILLFIGLFAASTIIVARVVINTRKRRRKANEEIQTCKAELEAREHKLKTLEERIAAQTRDLEAREASLKRETEELIREREDVAAMRRKLNTDEEKIAAEQATFEKKVQEHLTKERHLQDIAAELESKSKHLATFEDRLKKTCEELEAKDFKLTALREEIDSRASALMRERERLDEHEAELKALQDKLKYEKEEMEHKIAEIIEDKKNLTEERSALKIAHDKLLQFEAEIEEREHDLKAQEDKITAQKQELASKEDTLKKDAETLIREREDITTIRKELITETERIAEERAILEERTKQLASFEDRLKKTNEELEAKDLNLSAKEEEIETRAAALVREKEDMDVRDMELKALRDELESYKEEIDLRIVSIIKDKKNLAEECSALKSTRENLEKQVAQLEAKLQLCEEHRHNAENERKPLEVGEQQKTRQDEAGSRAQQEREQKADEESQEKAEKEPLPPGKRGGRPRGQSNESEKEQGSETKPRSLKPEIICWKEGWSWVIGIEVPEELESLCVTQNEELLERDNIDESRYHLKQADGIVKVTWTEGSKVLSLIELNRNYLVFKMRKNWKEPGRLVQRSTNGYYLIVAPQEWERDKEISGDAPVNPESTQLEGYKAYFFYKEQKLNNTVGFIAANGNRIQVESGSPRFQLVGDEIIDASEDMGPLFGGQPPSIQSLDEKGWSNVEVIVAGEEGKGRNRWRTQFSPQLAEKEQKLPEELRSRHGGWYFVRIYDNDDNLLESMDFRFMEGLKDIKVHSYSFLPGPSGHQPVRVEFLHKPRCHIRLVKGNPESLQIKHEDELMSAIIPSHPAWDVTDWEIRCDRQKVIVGIMIERIWWNLTEDDSLPATELLDSPLSIRHDSINATSNTAILLWFPKPRWIQTILVGFEKSKSRPYSVEVNDRKIRIPLREFSDADEIENKTLQVLLRLWLVDRNTLEDGIVICEILPKKEPTPIPPEGPIQPVIEPDQMPCCNTCDHARTHHNNYWCRRYHWTQVSASEFTEKFERFKCAEWRGEYFNAKHKYWKR